MHRSSIYPEASVLIHFLIARIAPKQFQNVFRFLIGVHWVIKRFTPAAISWQFACLSGLGLNRQDSRIVTLMGVCQYARLS